MDKATVKQLFESLIKDYETEATHALLMYSTKHERDFKIITNKVKDYRKRLKDILDGPEDVKKV